MNKNDKIAYWVDIADYDLATAGAMLDAGRYLYVVFMCQQAMEKAIKALYIKTHDNEPPRSHNLGYVFNKLGIPAPQKFMELFTILTAYYIETRYPAYKERLSAIVSREMAEAYFKRTQEAYEWLKSLLT